MQGAITLRCVNFRGRSGRDTNERWVFGLQTRAVQGGKYIVYKVISRIY
jgi:hypothetical protein